MSLVRRVARPMMAGIFVMGGIEQLRNPSARVPAAAPLAPKVAGAVNASAAPVTLPTDTETLVRLNGGVMLGAGLLLATSRFPRVASAALIGTLAPTTVVGHPFWQEPDGITKKQQRDNFFKNLSMLGGLLLAVMDTDGRESVPRATRRAAKLTRREAKAKVREGQLATELAVERARRKGTATAAEARRAVGV